MYGRLDAVVPLDRGGYAIPTPSGATEYRSVKNRMLPGREECAMTLDRMHWTGDGRK